MITRSKTRATRQAQHETKTRRAAATHAPVQQPCSRVTRVVPQARQPRHIPTGSNGQVQHQQAELEAALPVAIDQTAEDHDQAILAEAAVDQYPVDGVVFDAAPRATFRARLDLMLTSCKIAGEFFQIAAMACQTSARVQQEITSISSFITSGKFGVWLGVWPGIVAFALFVLLLHLFNVLFVRRMLTQESLAERVTASAALFLGM